MLQQINIVDINRFEAGLSACMPEVSFGTYKSIQMPDLQMLLQKKEQLTLTHLMAWPPGIICFGTAFAQLTTKNEHIKWIAEKQANCRWHIKAALIQHSYDKVYDQGKLITCEATIKHMVNCDWEAFEMYKM